MTRDNVVANVVAGSAFFASAAHIVEVVSETNYLAFALVYPVAIDGMIYVGIRAAQKGRKFAGFAAIILGSIYSLLFNADAEEAIRMDRFLVAASMPVSMLISFLVIHTGHKIIKEAPVVVEKIIKKDVPPTPKVDVLPTPKKDASIRPSTTGRTATWDVEKAVRLFKDGRTDVEIQEAIPVGAKPWQRTKRAIRLLSDTTDSAEQIAATAGVSITHVLRIRAALVSVAP